MAADYYKNAISFSTLPGTTLSGAEFTTKALSISPGQDPLRKNNVGGTHSFSTPGSGSFIFEVGRVPSSDVATFWNNTLRYNEYTPTSRPELLEVFSPPSQLYFAFKGTLTLKLTGGALTGSPYWLKFNDVCFGWGWNAKYSKYTWYFGAKGAKPYGGSIQTKSSQSVTIMDSENKYEVLFYRYLPNMDELQISVLTPPVAKL